MKLGVSKKFVVLVALVLFNRLIGFDWLLQLHVPKIVNFPINTTLLILALYFERAQLPAFFIKFKNIKKDICLGLILGVIFCASIQLISHYVFKEQSPPINWTTFSLLPILWLVAGWRAALYEELLFRSCLMGLFNKWTNVAWLAILLQAVIFLSGHSRYFHHGVWDEAFFVAIDGLLFGIIAYWRKSITPTILIHSMINTFGVMVFLPSVAFHKALFSWLL